MSKTYDATPEKSLSSISTGSSSVESIENFAACVISVDTTELTAENFNTHIEVLNSNLDTLSAVDTAEPTKYKIYFSASAAGKLFTYTTINSTGAYSTRLYNSASDYLGHTKKLQTATDNIYLTRETLNKLPICIMFSLLYIMTRIHSLSRGCGYIPKKKKQKKSDKK